MIITTTDAVVGKEPALNAAADVHQVRSVDELKNLLTTIDHPITTLYINSEATSDAILIGGAYKNVIDLAGEIAGSLPIHSAPKLLDMRSCNLGTNPGAMNSLRDALGARQVMGGTCFLVQLPIKPMIVEELDDQGNWIRDIEVTNKSQFGGKKWLKNTFDDAFQQHLTDIDTGRDLVPCIVGSKGTLEGAKSAYFKNKGWLMEAYYTPSTTGDRSNSRFRCFDEARAGGKVYKANNLPALANYSADPCQTITVKKK